MGKTSRTKPLKAKAKAPAKSAINGHQRTTAKAKPGAAKASKPPVKSMVKKTLKPVAKPQGPARTKQSVQLLKSAIKAPAVAAKRQAEPTSKAAMKNARSKQSSIILPDGYRPSEKEPFMSEMQRMYFRQKLVHWKEDIIHQNRVTLNILHDDTGQYADIADRATSETDRALELRARDRQRKLVSKIDAAISRIEDGSYGYCEETGEPISLKRLDARPIATLSLEAQERHERRERVYRED